MASVPNGRLGVRESRQGKRASLAQLIFILFSTWVYATEFVYLGEQRWPTQTQVEKTRFGGISGLAFRGEKIFLVSDDRGLVNEPRFYEFNFSKDKDVWKLTDGRVHFVRDPAPRPTVLDQEAIVALPDGHFLISSEGDNNKKPRVPPRIYEVEAGGQWLHDVILPTHVIPEPTGQQKKGVGNNLAFEAMALGADSKDLFFLSERPLVQDVNLKEDFSRYRFFHFKKNNDKKNKDTYIPEDEWYLQAPPPLARAGIPVLQGWSEMLHREGKNFWVLERTLRVLGGKSLQFDCRLAELDMTPASAVKAETPLYLQKDLKSGNFVKLHVLQGKGGEDLGNCEGLALGPGTQEYKQTLWVVTDNNFGKSEDTVLYFFGVKN